MNYEKILKKLKIVVLNDGDYKDLLDKLYKINVIGFDKNTIGFGGNIQGIPFIFLHEEYNTSDKDYQRIYIAHEAAHAIGCILNEEEADKWALDALNETQQNILKNEWPFRHGHKYHEMEEK